MRIWPWTQRKELRWCGMRSCSQKGKISNYRRWVKDQVNAKGLDETRMIMVITTIKLTLCLQIKCLHCIVVFFFYCDLVVFCFLSVSGLSSLGKWFDWQQSAEHFQRKFCGICSKKEVDCDDVVVTMSWLSNPALSAGMSKMALDTFVSFAFCSPLTGKSQNCFWQPHSAGASEYC